MGASPLIRCSRFLSALYAPRRNGCRCFSDMPRTAYHGHAECDGGSPVFLRNAWYVAAWDHEVGRALFPRTLLNTNVVMFRGEDGRVAALEDRCCHRNAPLSAGTLIGDEVQCGYHGLRYDGTGRCVEVPSQSQVPPGAQVRGYPAVERHRRIWLWMG